MSWEPQARFEPAHAHDDSAATDERAPAIAPGKRTRTQSIRPRQGPLTELAAAATAVIEAAGAAQVALRTRRLPDAELARLATSVVALGDVLHRRAGRRDRSDEHALRHALRAAGGVADVLASQRGPRGPHEVDLRQRIGMVSRLAAEHDRAASSTISAAALRSRLEHTHARLVSARAAVIGIAAQVPEADLPALDRAIAVTAGWQATLAAESGSARAAAQLGPAIVAQEQIVTGATAELQLVLAAPPTATTDRVIAAYVHALARSTERHAAATKSLERARALRRRQPLDQSRELLDRDEATVAQLGALDRDQGNAARRDHAALERRGSQLERRIAGGAAVSRVELDEVVVATREQTFLHRMQLLESQARALADALDRLDDGVMGNAANGWSDEIPRLVDDLRGLGRVAAGARAGYRERVFIARDEATHGDVGDRGRVAAAKGKALDESEAHIRDWLASGYFGERVERAMKVMDKAETRLFAANLITTIALTLTGNVAASLARGAAEGAWLARGAAIGADVAETAATARVLGSAAAWAADTAVNVAGQKLIQGDDASLVTLVAANVLTPLAIDAMRTRLRVLDRLGDSTARSATLWAKIKGASGVAFRHGVALQSEMITGAAVDYATRRAMQQGGAAPTDQTAADWLAHGAAIAVGRHLGRSARETRARLERLEQLAHRVRRDLVGRAEHVERQSVELERTGDLEQALDLAAQHDRLLAEEHAALQELHHGTSADDAHAALPPTGGAAAAPRPRILEPFVGDRLDSARDLQRRHPGADVIAAEARFPPPAEDIEAFRAQGGEFLAERFAESLPPGSLDKIYVRYPIPHEKGIENMEIHIMDAIQRERTRPGASYAEVIKRVPRSMAAEIESVTNLGLHAIDKLRPGGTMEIVYWEKAIYNEVLALTGRVYVDPVTAKRFSVEIAAPPRSIRRDSLPDSGTGIPAYVEVVTELTIRKVPAP